MENMKPLTNYIKANKLPLISLSEKLIVNKNYKPSSSERPFDEILSAIEGLRRDGKYHVIDPKNHFNIDMPRDISNVRVVNKYFNKMDMCILYNTKICDKKLYIETFNKCEYVINHNSDDLNIVLFSWDDWTPNGYKRSFTIIEDPDDMVVMIVNDHADINNTYILVGM